MRPSTSAAEAPSYDGRPAQELAALLGVPRLELRGEVTSTMDVGHELAAAGVPAGTLVLADRQTAGRGRAGRNWASPAAGGIWLTLVERPSDSSAIDVLSLRLGIRAAQAVERFAEGPVRLKWPNDLYVGAGKLAGVLVEARWRDQVPEWVAIGFGLNVTLPTGVPTAAALRTGTARVEVLGALVPALRAAAAARGPLLNEEVAAFAERDLAAGRRCTAPVAGTVRGITPGGELRVAAASGEVTVRGGSLLLEDGG